MLGPLTILFRNLGLAAALGAAAVPAYAQQRPPTAADMDQDRDGKVSPAEYRAGVMGEFLKYDRNKDGRVQRSELPAFAKLPGVSGQVDRIWKIYDASGDGIVTREEVAARADLRFRKLDADGDGVLTQPELEAARAAARQARTR